MMSPQTAKIVHQFVRLNLANFAFLQVKRQAEHIIESQFSREDLLVTPHFAGLVVTYAKNFTESAGIGPLPVSYAKLPAGILTHTHKILMESRHTIYAHRDVKASKSFVYDDGPHADPYEMEISFSKVHGLTCHPKVPELNPGILRHVVDLCIYQNSRIVADVSAMLPVLTSGKMYKEGVRYVIGKDFP
jgi:hypothetical protein